jgi:molybdopterin converting factor small subunit
VFEIQLDVDPSLRSGWGTQNTRIEDEFAMKIFITTPLRAYTGKQDTVEVGGATIHEALGGLTTRYPDLRKQLFTDDGKLRSFVNVYLNDEDIRYLDAKEQTAVSDGDSLSIIPSIAGGAGYAAMHAAGA